MPHRQHLRIRRLFGGASANTSVGMAIHGHRLDLFGPVGGCGTAYSCNSFTNMLINPNSFGFYICASPTSKTSPGARSDGVVSFQNGISTNWLFAYEDGTDFDYNDMAVKVESIRAAVSDPEAYALMLPGWAR